MNKLTIIGNLTRDPETRTTQSGKNVCTFTVAVNKRNRDQEPDYFRVSAWSKLGESCQNYLAKGRKVCVVGQVSVNAYTANNGENRASLEVFAEDVEFLSAKGDSTSNARPASNNNGYEDVTDDDFPF